MADDIYNLVWGNKSSSVLPNLQSYGLDIGVITQNFDEKDETHKGMISVKVIGMAEGANISRWMKVAVPYAGKDRGLCFWPEVGDEVLVAYINGDKERPVAIGFLWNPSEEIIKNRITKENVLKKWIRSKCGHEIEFTDVGSGDSSSNDDSNKEDPDKPNIKIHTSKKLALKFSDQNKKIIISGGADSPEKDNSVILDQQNGKIAVTGQTEISFTVGTNTIKISKSGIEINSDSIKINSKNELNIQSNAAVNIKGNKQVSIDGGTQAQLKGAKLQLEGSTGVVVSSSAMIQIGS